MRCAVLQCGPCRPGGWTYRVGQVGVEGAHDSEHSLGLGGLVGRAGIVILLGLDRHGQGSVVVEEEITRAGPSCAHSHSQSARSGAEPPSRQQEATPARVRRTFVRASRLRRLAVPPLASAVARTGENPTRRPEGRSAACRLERVLWSTDDQWSIAITLPHACTVGPLHVRCPQISGPSALGRGQGGWTEPSAVEAWRWARRQTPPSKACGPSAPPSSPASC